MKYLFLMLVLFALGSAVYVISRHPGRRQAWRRLRPFVLALAIALAAGASVALIAHNGGYVRLL